MDDALVIDWRDAGLADVPAVGRLMRAAFDPGFGEMWSDAQLAGALGSAGHRLQLAVSDGALAGFTLSRQVLDEVELLLCATALDRRRRGIGRLLLRRAMVVHGDNGATRMFLEVRANNEPALALYRAHGFSSVGRRPAYYRGSNGQNWDAITLDCPLHVGK